MNIHPNTHASYSSRIAAVGSHLPSHEVSMDEVESQCENTTPIGLSNLTGIRTKRIASEDEDALALAEKAARDCLAHAPFEASDLEIVINCSISRMVNGLELRFEPPLGVTIARRIGASSAIGFDVTNACAGMLTGLSLLDNLVRSGAVRRGMVVSGEHISNIAKSACEDITSWASEEVPSLTIGDAGAAVILERCDPSEAGVLGSELVTLSQHADLCIGRPRTGKAGTSMFTKAKALHAAAIPAIAAPLRRLVDRLELRAEDLAWFVPHQTSTRSIRSGIAQLRKEFDVPSNTRVAVTVDRYGNTASTTHFVALKRLLDHQALREGDLVLFLAYASGIVVGGVIIRVGGFVERYGHNY